ncbi:sensor histidine kinase [Enemella sp. A6]|uniref:sensor histidine kinase n=1 Tax=Enemella sp. A6 TaxID=3440152 RepID=UPI003EBACF7A
MENTAARRWWQVPLLLDSVIAAALALFLVLGGHGYWSNSLTGVINYLLPTLGICGLLALRRVRPLLSAIGIYGIALLNLMVAGPYGVAIANALVLLALYSVTVHGPRFATIPALLGALFGIFLLVITSQVDGLIGGLYPLVPGIGAVVAVWALAMMRRAREERLRAVNEKARLEAVSRSREAEIAVTEERARIAREMHDVVAHSLSVVIAQADGGRYAAAHDSDAAVRALTTISEIGRDALADIRRILGVLREGDEGQPLTTPQPLQDNLDELIAGVRGTGARVSLVRTGEAQALPPGFGLAVHRIVQEGLTNALKHAGPKAAITVGVHWRPGILRLQVDDDGRGAGAISDGKGTGLLGVKERAGLFGGTVQAGPRPGGGWRMRADLPLLPGTEQE